MIVCSLSGDSCAKIIKLRQMIELRIGEVKKVIKIWRVKVAFQSVNQDMTMIKWRNKEVEKKVGDVHEEGVYFDKAVIDWKRNTCEVAG